MTPCQYCGEPLKLVPIVWGYPTDETFESARRGEVALGGCVIGDDDPEFACANCQEPVPPSALMADRAEYIRADSRR